VCACVRSNASKTFARAVCARVITISERVSVMKLHTQARWATFELLPCKIFPLLNTPPFAQVALRWPEQAQANYFQALCFFHLRSDSFELLLSVFYPHFWLMWLKFPVLLNLFSIAWRRFTSKIFSLLKLSIFLSQNSRRASCASMQLGLWFEQKNLRKIDWIWFDSNGTSSGSDLSMSKLMNMMTMIIGVQYQKYWNRPVERSLHINYYCVFR
jgi:hypothetical protein